MAKITDYTSTEAIIGALGLTDNEVEAEMLVNQQIDLALLTDLYSWLPGHAAIRTAGIAAAATEVEKMTLYLLQLYSTWYCAAKVAKNMWLAMPQRISDGKVDMRRFATLDLKKIAEAAAAEASSYKTQLLAIEGATDATEALQLIGLASPSYDPVTGTET